MAPKSKRARKAAAKKRKDAAAAAAAGSDANAAVPMDIVTRGETASAASFSDEAHEAMLASTPSATDALHTALYGGGASGAYDCEGMHVVAFAAAPGLARLSAEELRLASGEAQAACRHTLGVTLAPAPFACVTERPRIATPAPAAARLAWSCAGAVLGVALEPADAAMAAHTAAPPMSADGGNAGGVGVSAYRAPYGTADDPVVGDPRVDLYAFHAYCPGDAKSLRALHQQHERHLELLPTTDMPYEAYDEAVDAYYNDPDYIPRPIPIVDPADGSIKVASPKARPAMPPGGNADGDRGGGGGGGGVGGGARTSSASSDTKDGCATPTGSSLWTSFNKLFSFGRSPDAEGGVTEGVPMAALPDSLPDALATSPTTPQSCAPGSTTCGSEEERVALGAASGGGGGGGGGGGSSGASSSRGSRRVLRAARTLKQPPSSPSGAKDTDGAAASGGGSSDVGQLADLLCATTVADGAGRRKKLAKVKRRPRVRLVPEDDDD